MRQQKSSQEVQIFGSRKSIKDFLGKLNLIATFLIALTVFAVFASAMLIPVNDNAKGKAKAPENSPVIDENWDLERVDFIHYVKPENLGKSAKTDSCYKLMGVKWKSLPVSYIINPSNPEGLSESFVTSAISTSAETWDTSTASELFNNVYGIDYTATYGIQNFVNVVDFGDYPDDRVIAVTSVWYTPVGRQIVEFDIRFNTRFSWGNADLNPGLMDLQNIATHELGHSFGLADIYSTACAEVTMYGYSTEGEVKKRTLEQPDIIGIQKLYG